jgi:hypothetical protein
VVGTVSAVRRRRICWPNPDAVCLQGGCSYCNDYDFRPLAEVFRYARRTGQTSDYWLGWDNFWWNRIDTR